MRAQALLLPLFSAWWHALASELAVKERLLKGNAANSVKNTALGTGKNDVRGDSNSKN